MLQAQHSVRNEDGTYTDMMHGGSENSENAANVVRISDEAEQEKLMGQGGRTDEEISCQAPIVVTLGGKRMEIPILAYRTNKKWRDAFLMMQKKGMALQKAKAGLSDKEAGESLTFEEAKIMSELWLDDKVDLVLLYLRLSDVVEDDSILDKATDLEFLAAYEKIEPIATPLSESRIPKRS